MSKPVTLKELAKKLNVSISTISKALNDSPEISEQRKRKIKEVAELLNYQPNIVAKQLKEGKTNTIGVVIPSIQNNFFVQVLDGIERTLRAANLKSIISISQESLQLEDTIIKTFSTGIVDGVIIAIAEESQKTKTVDHLLQLESKDIPLVLFDRTTSLLKSSQVCVNDKESVKEATQNFIDKGLQNILVVSTISNTSVGKSRIEGYKEALHSKSLKVNVCSCEPDTVEQEATKAIKAYNPEAIICLDEESTLATYHTLKQLNTKTPLIGYINEKLASNMSPSISTINQHGFNIGCQAAEKLIFELQHKDSPKEKVLLKSTFHHRETTQG